MSLASLLRDAVVRAVRPGQPLASVVAHRLLRRDGLGSGNAVLLNHCDGDGNARVSYARYCRSRYGGASYG
jgi:hypothetical protein